MAYTIDASSGGLALVGSPMATGTFDSVTVDPTGRFVYVVDGVRAAISAFAINGSTGALTAIGSPLPAGLSASCVTVDPSGKFAFVVDPMLDDLFTFAIDPSTGALTQVGSPLTIFSGPISVVTTSEVQ